jgi:hypothetical protein
MGRAALLLKGSPACQSWRAPGIPGPAALFALCQPQAGIAGDPSAKQTRCLGAELTNPQPFEHPPAPPTQQQWPSQSLAQYGLGVGASAEPVSAPRGTRQANQNAPHRMESGPKGPQGTCATTPYHRLPGRLTSDGPGASPASRTELPSAAIPRCRAAHTPGRQCVAACDSHSCMPRYVPPETPSLPRCCASAIEETLPLLMMVVVHDWQQQRQDEQPRLLSAKLP